MNLDRYTEKAQQAILDAQRLAQGGSHAAIKPIHVLFALVRQPEGVVDAIVARLAGSTALLAEDLQQDLARRPQTHGETARS